MCAESAREQLPAVRVHEALHRIVLRFESLDDANANVKEALPASSASHVSVTFEGSIGSREPSHSNGMDRVSELRSMRGPNRSMVAHTIDEEDVFRWLGVRGFDHVQRGLVLEELNEACRAFIGEFASVNLPAPIILPASARPLGTHDGARPLVPLGSSTTGSSIAFSILQHKGHTADNFDFTAEAQSGVAAAAESSTGTTPGANSVLSKVIKEEHRRERRMQNARNSDRNRIVATYKKWEKAEEARKVEEKKVKKEIKKRRIRQGVDGPLPEEEEMLERVRFKPPPPEPPPEPEKGKVHERLNSTRLQRSRVLETAMPEYADPAAKVTAAKEDAINTRERREFMQVRRLCC